MAITVSGSSNPVTQMLSANTDSQTISSWLKDFVKAVGGKPQEVVVDESRSILLASIKAFTEFECIGTYMNRCHKIITIKFLY